MSRLLHCVKIATLAKVEKKEIDSQLAKAFDEYLCDSKKLLVVLIFQEKGRNNIPKEWSETRV